MTIGSFTCIIWEANAQIDARKPAPFNFDEVYLAASEGRLIDLLDAASRNFGIGFVVPLMLEKKQGNFRVEEALGAAADYIEGQELGKAAIGDNPWCLVIAIALTALQSRFPD